MPISWFRKMVRECQVTRYLDNGKGEKGSAESVIWGAASCKPKPRSHAGSSSGCSGWVRRGPGGLQHMGGLQPAAPIAGSFGAGRSYCEKMQPLNPSLSKDQHLRSERAESYKRVQATWSLNERFMLASSLCLLWDVPSSPFITP